MLSETWFTTRSTAHGILAILSEIPKKSILESIEKQQQQCKQQQRIAIVCAAVDLSAGHIHVGGSFTSPIYLHKKLYMVIL